MRLYRWVLNAEDLWGESLSSCFKHLSDFNFFTVWNELILPSLLPTNSKCAPFQWAYGLVGQFETDYGYIFLL